MSKPTKTGHELAIETLMGWALGIAARDEGPLEGLHELLIQQLYDKADKGGMNSSDQQRVLAEAIQVLDGIFVVAVRAQLQSQRRAKRAP